MGHCFSHINIASHNYLYEVAAIPADVRKAYLQQLLKRKNAAYQKNVKLILIIERLLAAGNISAWNPGAVCAELDISADMLYCHKSRYLKGLRVHYFHWKEEEKKLRDVYTPSPAYELARAKKMYERGMRREAKSLFLKLEQKYKKKKRVKENILILSDIYEHLIDYYFNQRNLFKFNLYFTLLQSLTAKALKQQSLLQPEEQALLKIKFNTALACKCYFHHLNDKALQRSKEELIKVLDEARTHKHKPYYLLALLRLGMLEMNLTNHDSAYRVFRTGMRAAGKKYPLEYYTFLSFINYIDYTSGKGALVRESITRCRQKTLELNPHSMWYIQTLNNYSQVIHNQDMDEYEKARTELNNREILYPRLALAWTKILIDNLSITPLCKWKLYAVPGQGKLLTAVKPELEEVDNMQSFTQEALFRFKNLRFMNYKISIYLARLWCELVKGKDSDFESALSTIKSMDWMLKTRHLGGTDYMFRVLKLGVLMINTSQYYSKDTVLRKYSLPFKSAAESLLKEPGVSLMSAYFVISTIARELNYKEIWQEARSAYNYILKNHYQVIEPVLKEFIISGDGKDEDSAA